MEITWQLIMNHAYLRTLTSCKSLPIIISYNIIFTLLPQIIDHAQWRIQDLEKGGTILYKIVYIGSCWKHIATVEPLIKATPEMRPPLYKGHFARSQMCILIQINP